MDLRLKDKNAVVMAASKGIGRAIALRLAGEGVDVAICARGESSLVRRKGSFVRPVCACMPAYDAGWMAG